MSNYLGDDVAEAVDLLLADDLIRNPARILNVLLPMQHIPHGFRFRTHGIPHIDPEHDGVAARIIVEDRFSRGVRQDTAVPIVLTVDADRRKSRRESRARHDVVHSKWHLTG